MPEDYEDDVPGEPEAWEQAEGADDDLAGLLARAEGTEWYEHAGGAADRAAYTLCHVRRARAAETGMLAHGDEAVREALGGAERSALVWLASRAISYMDESGFPETVERYFPEETAEGE